jgi:hypothetical protein
MNRKQFLITAAAAVTAATMLACGTGSGDTSSSVTGGDGTSIEAADPKPTTAVGKLGQTITLTSEFLGDKTIVEITVANAKQHTKEPGSFGSKPDKGVFLVLDVTAVSKQGTYHANPYNFKFVAKDGTVSDTAFAIAFKPSLDAIDLATGQKTTGKIVFDVSKASLNGARIQIDGVGLDANTPAAYWSL